MANTFRVKVQRQDKTQAGPYWETFDIPYEDGMNVTTVLQRVAANPVTSEGQKTTPVAYDACCLEEVCGACSMVINGRVRQACSALVDNLLKESPEGIELRPMSKFPVVRDLFVNRSFMFEILKKVRAWVPVDGYHDLGAGPAMPPQLQEKRYPLSRCMTCGCCLEACPQFGGRSDFIGAQAIGQAVLFNAHPTGEVLRDERLAALSGPGGISDCGNAQNCAKVCPKEVPLLYAIGVAGRDTTLYKFRQWFGK